MIPLSLVEISAAVGGQLVGDNITINSVVTDSRALQKGDVFLALKGPNFDGHKFVHQVAEQGCCALIVAQQQDIELPQIIVEDTRIALGQIGALVKERVAPKTIAITGSSGKTTVKEMVAAILSRLGKVLATDGNFNNDIGVPLTLLRLEQQHDFAVIELGANHIGEISYTCNLVKPDIAIINNIAAAHLEGFGDLCGVARAKGEIFEGLKNNGLAIYNQDCQYATKWLWRLTDKNVAQFSCLKKADFCSSNVVLDDNGCATFSLNTPAGRIFIELTVPGRHNVCNAVAAASIAMACGASLDDIRLGLAEMASVNGRLNLHHLGDNFKLIDDTYNANVESVKAASELLASYSGRRILILGDMGELGSDARSYHQEVGDYAKSLKIDDLLTLGVLSQSASDSFNGKGQHFNNREKLMSQLQNMLSGEAQQIAILVKGSRSAHMEHVVEAIKDWRSQYYTEEQV